MRAVGSGNGTLEESVGNRASCIWTTQNRGADAPLEAPKFPPQFRVVLMLISQSLWHFIGYDELKLSELSGFGGVVVTSCLRYVRTSAPN